MRSTVFPVHGARPRLSHTLQRRAAALGVGLALVALAPGVTSANHGDPWEDVMDAALQRDLAIEYRTDAVSTGPAALFAARQRQLGIEYPVGAD